MKVLITDAVDPVCSKMLAEQGIETEVHLKKTPAELAAIAPGFDGWIIRSGTTITADLIKAATDLKVIGRAGVGVDNIDLNAATKQGVLVLNAPDGNTLSTAEHTCAMLMALSRNIPQASASVMAGKWDRKSFMGSELYGKTLGVVGLGKIGRAVAERMKGFGMKLIGFDPFLSEEVAAKLGIKLVDMAGIFADSDFITVHTPLTDQTRGMFNAETLAACKKGVRIANCARGGIFDEVALLDALNSNHVAGAAMDVYSVEPPHEAMPALLAHPNTVLTPHIAASTEEAQLKVAVQVTEQVIEGLFSRPVQTPVNAMAIKMAAQPEIKPSLKLAEVLGSVAAQLSVGACHKISIRFTGDLMHRYSEVLSVGVLKGALSHWSDIPVNYINAKPLAGELGLAVDEHKSTEKGEFTNLLEVRFETKSGVRSLAGVVFGEDDPRLVSIDGFKMEVKPVGNLLFYTNIDKPGMLATVGTILADNDINIASLSLGRQDPGKEAVTVIQVDAVIPDAVLGLITTTAGVQNVCQVQA